VSTTTQRHKSEAPKTLSFAVVTISTSKYSKGKEGAVDVEDKSGDIIATLLKQAGHNIAVRSLTPDDPPTIEKTIKKFTEDEKIDAVVTTGGTGVTKHDVTIETAERLMDKRLPGFGEALRRLSYDQIGSAAIMTRATAGTRQGKAIFCLPGSPNAVETAVKNLIIPEAAHIVKHSRE
jgi:molybdenum cofactor biosynthesis protein B